MDCITYDFFPLLIFRESTNSHVPKRSVIGLPKVMSLAPRIRLARISRSCFFELIPKQVLHVHRIKPRGLLPHPSEHLLRAWVFVNSMISFRDTRATIGDKTTAAPGFKGRPSSIASMESRLGTCSCHVHKVQIFIQPESGICIMCGVGCCCLCWSLHTAPFTNSQCGEQFVSCRGFALHWPRGCNSSNIN